MRPFDPCPHVSWRPGTFTPGDFCLLPDLPVAWATGEHLQLADADAGRGERREREVHSEAERREESIETARFFSRGPSQLWIWNFWAFKKKIKKNPQKKTTTLVVDVRIGPGQNWTMQRRHSASIMGRHQDHPHPPRQVQYCIHWTFYLFAHLHAALCAVHVLRALEEAKPLYPALVRGCKWDNLKQRLN